MKTLPKLILACLAVLCLSRPAFSQDAEPGAGPVRELAENAFTGSQLVNMQTPKVLPAGTWFFEIQHRFGKIGIDSSLTQQFLGLDLPANIRLAMGMALTDRFYLEVGRSNYLKTVDLEGKYLLFRQSKDFSMPVSIALYASAALRTERWPNLQPNSYYEDTITPFFYKPSHRLSYHAQAIISSKLSDRISVQLAPQFVYQNLVAPGYDNYTVGLSAGGRFRFGMNSSIIVEYGHTFNNRLNGFKDPLSAGVEFGTAGHVFQIFASTGTKILEQHIYTTQNTTIANGEFTIGFNMQRNFWKK